jgi:hypothetical protein
MWKTIKAWFATLFRRSREIFVLIARGVADDVLTVLNDPDLQALAVDACRRAAAEKLAGNDAWGFALDALLSELRERGIQLATNIVETVLQTAYTVWKYQGKP